MVPVSRHENQNKKRKKWRSVYRKFDITQIFNIEDAKAKREVKYIRVTEIKKGYIWRTIMKAVTFYFYNLEPTSCLSRSVSAFALY